MIFPAVDIIRQELTVIGGVNTDLGNISEIINDSTGSGVNADVVISLINIEENRISRDPSHFIRKDPAIIFKNPAIHLNLTLLFTSVRRTGGYGLSLQDLQNVISFFQRKYVFDHTNTPGLHVNIEKLVLDMVSLNLQQLHEIWSVLGGRYFPSVVYKMRMVTIDTLVGQEGPPVKEVMLNF
ncbi:DUF4255 domain-containing protein [Chryseolinea lacunae]|uniref:DUF4255 domain-containing protein n=1 Tax=Chryseolinea lacunae TaxID=2801331 RepID=A0ABS1KPE8_9BACT|nr:DUF4255 domain-containing protein [Chryseolinea lacunae]MBL0741137.1 DUF4255 domain-containing protein [Chryseolinea lacunae]